ncbi:Neutral zinc metallopeptidase [Rubellimicrobium mesophilum DSM 19309]|uniref:Neutral zinc metallopeptidase n=1 Tax=Rubellimicrobium mesophilum DSM 19309 TaxID=442562 RepID=A0A017HNB2_9RHOB|nr:Neutral zinc metallopeptidase [Rubellimicrobium mesophilum DSM 19309]
MTATNVERWNISAGAADDTLYGGALDDTLNGGGGHDTLIGGLGNDTYIVDADDTVVRREGEGTADRILVATDHTLATSLQVEVLAAADAAGTAALRLTGNELAQTITGNAGANTLSDGGGTGADRLQGGAGSDTYLVGNALTLIDEGTGQGTADRVLAGVSFALASDDDVEALATTSSTATTAINLTGNALAQTITGNAGNNVLSDGGGGGKDLLAGLGGNDTFVIRNTGTTIQEGATEGTADKVLAGLSFALASDDYVEAMATTSSTATTAINLTGNTLAQTITGNAGVNRLNGGAGMDRLAGGAGGDVFVFSTALGASNIDTISDYKVVDDQFDLDDAVFTKLVLGNLASGAFVSNTTGLASATGHRIIYENDTGALFYDPDGSGTAARIQFAKLTAGLLLTASEFHVM